MSVPPSLRRPKVAIIFHRWGPYHWVRVASAAQNLEVCGVEAFAQQETYYWDRLEGEAPFEKVTVVPGSAASVNGEQLFARMAAVLDQYKPQVVAVPGWSDKESLVALRWCVDRRVPAVMMSDSSKENRPRSAWKEAIKRRLLKLASAGLVAGRPHAEYLTDLGMSRDRVFLGYDVVDNDYFARKAEEVRSQWSVVRGQNGLPERYFLASARFIWEKNLPRLIQAYARYRELAAKAENRNQKAEIWDLVLLGDGPLRETLNSQLSTLNLHGHVLLPGFKQYADIPAYYALAEALILPSISETWGLVVNEAMASGLPVLVSNRCGCASDLVQEGRNGFTFDPYNVEEIAQLMLKISAFNFPLSAFGSQSQRIIAAWGPERFANGLHDAVEAALKNPRPRAGLFDHLLLKALIYK